MRGAILAFVFGIWCLQQAPALPEPRWGFVLLIPLFVLLLLAHRQQRIAIIIKWVASLLLAGGLGMAWAASMASHRLADELPAEWEGKDIRLTGVVASLPQLGERGERFQLDVERVDMPGAHVPRHISLTRYFAGYHEIAPVTREGKFQPGERWQLTVRLKRPHGNYNPHGFDFELWALERNIRATGYVREDGENARLTPLVYRPAYLIERVRASVRERFNETLGEARFGAILQALAIGDDEAISKEDWETFRRTGVIHLMSISGLHVTMVAGVGFALVFMLWRHVELLTLWLPARKAATLAGLAAAGAYALVAGFAVPTQRTFYMLAVLALAAWYGRTIAMSRVLCWALLLVVVLDPWAVTASGFWLSFGAVALLVYAGSHRLAQAGWWREAARAQWVVTLGLTPLLLALFQQVSLISPLTNAVAIPVVSLVVTPLTLLGVLIPVDTILLIAHAVMSWCMALLETAAALPLAVWQQHAPPGWTVVVAVSGVCWMLLPRGFPLRWLGMSTLAPMFFLLPAQPAPGGLRVAILDVGQGLAVVLQTARHTLLYDTGPSFTAEADSGNRIVLPYLRSIGVGRLDGLVLTHDDSDHIGGAASVLRGMPVAWLDSSLPPGHPLAAMNAHHLRCQAGQVWLWDGVRFAVLHPSRQSYDNKTTKDNQRSCVLKVSTPYGSLLLTGDIGRASEAELLQRQASDLPADVLVVPHHGSKSSSTAGFLAAVRPSVAVFTVGYRNRYGHPTAEVVERYRELGSTIYRSDQEGSVLIRFLPQQGPTIITWRRYARRYWHDAVARVAENGGAG